MTLLESVIFFIPAGIGNMAPVLAAKMPGLRTLQAPIDFGKSWRGARILGDHKTWRGLVSGIIAGGLTALVLKWTGLYDPSWLSTAIIGSLLGFGALVGDSVKSFFKRRVGIASGKTWFPFDQIDYIIGGLLFIAPLKHLNLQQIAAILISYFLLHLLSTNIGYWLRLKKSPI